MKIINGDIIKLAPEFDVVIHGCNCFHKMGAGVAKLIAKNFPEALAADKKTYYGERKKLGTYSFANIKRNNKEFVILNAYTQFYYGVNRTQVDYIALKNVFKKIYTDFSIYTEIKLCYPKIGSGLGGGDWNVISRIIDEKLKDMEHYLINFG